ncbi:MAG: helix-turn-helix transcriptional regulator [Stomatobaculum sp.]
MEKYKSNLKELRLAAGLTLEELADEIGIGKRTIIAIENFI